MRVIGSEDVNETVCRKFQGILCEVDQHLFEPQLVANQHSWQVLVREQVGHSFGLVLDAVH